MIIDIVNFIKIIINHVFTTWNDKEAKLNLNPITSQKANKIVRDQYMYQY